MQIGSAAEEVVARLNYNIEGVLNASDPEQEAKYADAVCQGYELVAICELLLDAEVDEFFHCLIRGAQTRLWLLERAGRASGYPPRILRASNLTGLFAAVASSQWRLAERIARASPTRQDASSEYADDFCYAMYLHRHLMNAPTGESLEVLASFEAELEGAPSARFDLCRLLIEPNEADARECFEALLDEREAELESLRGTSTLAAEAAFALRGYLFVEGLAWLSLLRRSGTDLEGEFRLCPTPARTQDYQGFVVSTFPSVPLE